MRLAILGLSLTLASAAHADVGLGIGIGTATGPNVQLEPSDDSQVNLGVGLSLDQHIRVMADYAWRIYDVEPSAHVAMPIYMGVGAFYADRTNGTGGGVRIPMGVQAEFAHPRIQLFLDLAPELYVVSIGQRDDMTPPSRVGFSGLLGVRAMLD